MADPPARRFATVDDLLRLDPEGRYEILAGEIVEKAAPSGEHSGAQSAVHGQVWPAFDRRLGGPGGPGGWWILTEVDVALGPHDVIRPDVAGWRRDRVPERPAGFPVTERPDWVCEVLSPSTARRDLGAKRRLLHQHEVPWFWTVDPAAQLVAVLKWSEAGYLIHAVAGPGEHVELPPFAGLALDIGRIFGIEEEPAEGG